MNHESSESFLSRGGGFQYTNRNPTQANDGNFYYKLLANECTEEQLLEYLRKLFAFLSLQKFGVLLTTKYLEPDYTTLQENSVNIGYVNADLTKWQQYLLIFNLLVILIVLSIAHIKT
jgi:hypothetical protein